MRHVVDILKKSGKHDQLSISVGFSDDDKKNIEVATEFLQQELSMEFPSIKFVVYDTSDVSQGEKVRSTTYLHPCIEALLNVVVS